MSDKSDKNKDWAQSLADNLNTNAVSDQLKSLRKRFEQMTDQELIEAKERDARNPGWVAARALYVSALREEMESRGIIVAVSENRGTNDNDPLKNADDYPEYYDVDDLPVKVDYDPIKGEVFAVNWNNKPWSPLKASTEGNKIDEQTFDAAVEAYQQHIIDKTIDEKEFHSRISKLFGTQFFD